MYIEKTVDGSCGWDLGGRIDAIYGTDAQKTQAFGNPERRHSRPRLLRRLVGPRPIRLRHAAALRRSRLPRPGGEGRSLLHADGLRSDSRHRQLLLHPLVHDVQQRAVHPHRCARHLHRLRRPHALRRLDARLGHRLRSAQQRQQLPRRLRLRAERLDDLHLHLHLSATSAGATAARATATTTASCWSPT